MILLASYGCAPDGSCLTNPDDCSVPGDEYWSRFLGLLEVIERRDFGELQQDYSEAFLTLDATARVRFDVAGFEPTEPLYYQGPSSPSYEIVLPIDWAADPFGDRTWQLYFQALTWLSPYIEDARAGDRESRLLVLRVVHDWIVSNAQFPGQNSPYQWNDHGAAMRMATLIVALELYDSSDLDDDAFRALLLASVAAHVYRLAADANYAERHNHGVIADLALLYELRRVPELLRSADVSAKAESRLVVQFDYAFTGEGVHKEHSPCYHVMVSQLLAAFLALLEGEGHPDYQRLFAVLDGTAKFTTHVALPGGSVPPIGDCSTTAIEGFDQAYIDRHPTLDYLLSGGNRGQPPPEELAVFEESGWACMRSSWADPPTAVSHAVVQSDYWSGAHYQRDDTSFIVSAFGQPLLVDAGIYSYNDDPLDVFYRSAMAHNVLIVDGRDFDAQEANVGRSGITRSRRAETGASWMSAVELTHPHYESRGVVVHRQLVQLPEHAFAVRDVVDATAAHEYAQLFHMAPESIEQGSAWNVLELSWPTHSARLYLRHTAGEHRIIIGDTDPVQGWHFPERNVAVPNQVVEVSHRDVSSGAFTTYLVASESDSEPDWEALQGAAELAFSSLEEAPRRPLP
ncbi:MAG: heparinase II/III family protein [bacterium]